MLRFFQQEVPLLSKTARVESDLSPDLFSVEPATPRFRLLVRGSPASLSAVLYVRYDGQGTAYSNEGFGVLGSVPGALRVQNGSGANLTIIDEESGRQVEVRWQPCEVGSLCVLDAR